mmetsp:Transcript_16051/g.36822  ORF Transcript_16051/g.36822 Transcript_16051/m.36822 type:complete len:92 (-) Transcript_16051:98-373(-)
MATRKTKHPKERDYENGGRRGRRRRHSVFLGSVVSLGCCYFVANSTRCVKDAEVLVVLVVLWFCNNAIDRENITSRSLFHVLSLFLDRSFR